MDCFLTKKLSKKIVKDVIVLNRLEKSVDDRLEKEENEISKKRKNKIKDKEIVKAKARNTKIEIES